MKKVRLDEELVRCGLAEDKDRAVRLIMAGAVLVDDVPVDKAGTKIPVGAHLRTKTRQEPYASRGGRKLESGLQAFDMDVSDQIALDLGASTGGFTDCLLRFGAKRVYAVDVGTNQLAWQLRQDDRVVSLEKTHARQLDRALIPDPVAIVVADVSFTSLRYVLPFTFPLLGENARALCLFKPQFEVPAERVLTGGLVSETDAHAALDHMKEWCQTKGIIINASMPCPVKGRRGNREFLLQLDLSGV